MRIKGGLVEPDQTKEDPLKSSQVSAAITNVGVPIQFHGTGRENGIAGSSWVNDLPYVVDPKKNLIS